MKLRRLRKLTAASALLVALGTMGVATEAAAEIRQVDGHAWKASSTAEKRAYLVGVANTVAVNRAIQVKRGTLDPASANNRINAAIDAGTIDSAIATIDTWYGADASRLNTPVLGVVWLGLVKAAQ